MQDSLIALDGEAETKDEAISKTVDLLKQSGAVANAEKFLSAVLERESLGSTAIGRGIALPHARTQYIEEITIAFMRLKEGVDFSAVDGEPVRLIFLMGTPLKKVSEYLTVLSRLSNILKDESVRKQIYKAKSPFEIRTLFKKHDVLSDNPG